MRTVRRSRSRCSAPAEMAMPDDELGFDEAFLITKATFPLDGSAVELEVMSLPPAAYDWDAAAEERDAPPPSTAPVPIASTPATNMAPRAPPP